MLHCAAQVAQVEMEIEQEASPSEKKVEQEEWRAEGGPWSPDVFGAEETRRLQSLGIRVQTQRVWGLKAKGRGGEEGSDQHGCSIHEGRERGGPEGSL